MSEKEMTNAQAIGCVAGGVLIVVLGIAGIFVALKIKSDDYQKAKDQLTASCGSDQVCLAALNQHFDACFDANYRKARPSRYGSRKLMAKPFNDCMNANAGKDYFNYQPE